MRISNKVRSNQLKNSNKSSKMISNLNKRSKSLNYKKFLNINKTLKKCNIKIMKWTFKSIYMNKNQ